MGFKKVLDRALSRPTPLRFGCPALEAILLCARRTAAIALKCASIIVEYHALLDADSHGRYFLAHIRNYFPYERLTSR